MLQFTCHQFESADWERIAHIAEAAGIGKYAAQVLYKRGITDPEEAQAFMHALNLHDPYLLDGMAAAVDQISYHVHMHSPITVFGDYDCDGICASAILVQVLEGMGADVRCYIPSRYSEGYGLNKQAIENIAMIGGLLVTVDCGITSVDEVEFAKSLGLDVVVTDHHKPLEILPDCTIVNPHLSSGYPFQMLCGAGVALKVVQALCGQERAMEFVDIAALATVADIVPLRGENRTIVKLGLQRINASPRAGIRALIIASGLRGKEISAGHVAFALGPRLNSAGRMGDAMKGFELLATASDVEAERIAYSLNAENAKRQYIEESLVKAACDAAEMKASSHHCIMVAGSNWHVGVIGIVASRLVDLYGRPSVVMSIDDDGNCVGSARGLSGLSIFDALQACSDLLTRFGGHEMAGGFSLHIDHLAEFEERFNAFFREHYSAESWLRKVDYDLEVEPRDITVALAQELDSLAPFGFGNPSPVLLMREVKAATINAFGKTGEHLRLTFEKQDALCNSVMFRASGRDIPRVNNYYDIVGSTELYEWDGILNARCLLKAFRPAPAYILNQETACSETEHALSFSDSLKNYTEKNENAVEGDIFDFACEKLSSMPFGWLVVVRTPEATGRLIKRAGESGAIHFSEIYYGELPQTKDRRNAILVAPMSEVDYARFAHVVFVDVPLALDAVGSKCYTSYDKNYLVNYAGKLYMNRADMSDAYRALVSLCNKRIPTVQQICNRAAEIAYLTQAQAAAALNIFLELGFFTIDSHGRLNKVATPKRDLMESAIFRALSTLAGKR